MTDLTQQTQELTHLFNLLRTFMSENPKDNPKKLKKYAGQLILDPTINENAKLGILSDIMDVRDPVGYLRNKIRIAFELPQLRKDFIDEGYQGMFVLGNTIKPLNVNAPANWLKEDDRWSIEQETWIQHALVDAYLSASPNVKKFTGEVILFQECGFSGLPRLIYKGRSNE